MLGNRHSRLAISLAFLGQLVATFGLPMPIFGSARAEGGEGDSLCGCCPSDRSAGRCCCSRPINASDSSTLLEESAIEVQSPCCGKPTASSSNQSAPDSRVRWVSGFLRQRCQGPLDERNAIAVAPLSYPPEAAARWSFDWNFTESLQMIASNPVAILQLPATPPPR